MCNIIFSPYILETEENINLFYTFFPLCFSFIIKLSVIQHKKNIVYDVYQKSPGDSEGVKNILSNAIFFT